MAVNRNEILKNLCYTELVYARINKKLNTDYSKHQIEDLVGKILIETDKKYFSKLGKNYYVVNFENNIKLTINSNTFRIITASRLNICKN